MLRVGISALAGVIFAGHAAAAGVADLKDGYNLSAFQNADGDWRRMTANRVDECGVFGKNRHRRVDVLVDQYLRIGEALDAGDDQKALEAARKLSSVIDANPRFEKCWSRISRKERISREFSDMIAEL